jgi:hypothetical protein
MDSEVQGRAIFFIFNVIPWILLFLITIVCCISCYHYRLRTGFFENRENNFVRMDLDYLRQNSEEG